jgi:tetratricopeptide (TPR) repeat protein
MVRGLVLVLALLVQGESPATLAIGDEAFLRIDYPIAVSIYETLLTERPEDPEILWRLARVYTCMAEVSNGDEAKRQLKKAEDYARECILSAPSRAEGHTWLAGVLGYRALDAGATDQVILSNELVYELDKALAINPNDDAAYSIRGSFYRALGNIGWLRRSLAGLFIGKVPEGGYPEAEDALKHAIALAPGIMRHHYELGVLYLDMGRKPQAAECFERAISCSVQVAIDRPRLEKAKDLLSGLQQEKSGSR